MSGEYDAIILLLAFAGACVDTASFLGLGQVFTGVMTGNTIVFVLALTQHDLLRMARAGIALVGFVLGVAAGELILIQPSKRHRPPLLMGSLLIELFLLIFLGIDWWLMGSAPALSSIYPLIIFSALAMGIQSAIVRDIRKEDIATTYITGTLTFLWAKFTDWFWAQEWTPERKDLPVPRNSGKPQVPFIAAGIWIIYGVGAVFGGLAAQAWHSLSLLLPITAVVIVLILLSRKKIDINQ
jgi:uncharacterized membrane protein YoaK (UPF0700 family)